MASDLRNRIQREADSTRGAELLRLRLDNAELRRRLKSAEQAIEEQDELRARAEAAEAEVRRMRMECHRIGGNESWGAESAEIGATMRLMAAMEKTLEWCLNDALSRPKNDVDEGFYAAAKMGLDALKKVRGE